LNEDRYTQLPKLVYTPQVGDTIRAVFYGQPFVQNAGKRNREDEYDDNDNTDVKQLNTITDKITDQRFKLINNLNQFNNALFTNTNANRLDTHGLSITETNLRLQLLKQIAFDTGYTVKSLKTFMDYDTTITIFEDVNWKQLYDDKINEITNEINNLNIRQNYKELYDDINEINSMINSIKYYDIIEETGDSYIDIDFFQGNTFNELDNIYRLLPTLQPPQSVGIFQLPVSERPIQPPQSVGIFQFPVSDIQQSKRAKVGVGGNRMTRGNSTSKKNRRTKKKTSKPNKKNTRKNRRTKRKPSK
jgi:hypothetical protein